MSPATRTRACWLTAVADTHAWLRKRVLAERNEAGYWRGLLSPSALAVATAVSAFSAVSRERFGSQIRRGLAWLRATQNGDGGWGDTPDSPSNVSTSLLVESAFVLAGEAAGDAATGYLREHAGCSFSDRRRTLQEIYGRDRTFAVPILCNMAIAAEAAGEPVEWDDIPMLPFEMSCLPRRLLGSLRLHVVSYALPALIAIGHLLHVRRARRNPLTTTIRNLATGPALRKLERIQPASGGFLEAVPLTAFVVMSLAVGGLGRHPVVEKGLEFLLRGSREDGSWAIDSNLSVWLTTMSLNALEGSDDERRHASPETLDWLLECQHLSRHPYTGARPGGWAWTHLPGGVPDADDTSGALVALHGQTSQRALQAARAGAGWLVGLQNKDGGWPTFCRGWGLLPFDQSSPDITAHAIRALHGWRSLDPKGETACECGYDYLRTTQRDDGAWEPLWFGNQAAEGSANPVYGTARVLLAYTEGKRFGCVEARRGVDYLLGCRNDDGGWGGASGVTSSVEETALAVKALCATGPMDCIREIRSGAEYLVGAVRNRDLPEPTPIGLYFAKLWYSERLYPVIWTLDALGAVLKVGRRVKQEGGS